MRGGSFDNSPENLRSANRNNDDPEDRNRNNGFRCVRVPARQHAAKAPCSVRRGLFPYSGPPVPVDFTNRPGGPTITFWRQIHAFCPYGKFYPPERAGSPVACMASMPAGKTAAGRGSCLRTGGGSCPAAIAPGPAKRPLSPFALATASHPRSQAASHRRAGREGPGRTPSLLADIGPVYERSFIHHSYAAGSGRGPHRAVFQYLAWLRRFRYRLHLDIRGYFLNIDHARLRSDLFRQLEDAQTRWLIDVILRSSETVYRQPLAHRVLTASTPGAGKGLPLGSWFSQWCGAYYLNPMDHYLKRVLKVPGYLRYMDDCVLFCDDKSHLEDCRSLLAAWLAENRGLTLNPKKLNVTPNCSPGVFLGYRISRSGISPSRKLRRRMKARLRLAAEKGDDALIRSIRSYRGLLCFPHG